VDNEVKLVLQGDGAYYPDPVYKLCATLEGETEDFGALRLGNGESRAWYCRIPTDSCLNTDESAWVNPAPLYNVKVGVDETDNEEMSAMIRSALSPMQWYTDEECREYTVFLCVPYEKAKAPIVCYLIDGEGVLAGTTGAVPCTKTDTPHEDTYLISFAVRPAPEAKSKPKPFSVVSMASIHDLHTCC
jgi:hypothetical protein